MRKVISILMVLAMTLVLAVSSEAVLKRRKLPGYYVDQVNSLFVQHHWAKGKSLLDEGLAQYPNDPNLHYLAGRYWVRSKNYDQARYHLVKACHINYNHTDAKQLLVNVEEATGNYSSAICYVNELLEVNPYWKGLWLRKINLYKKEGNLEMANQFLRRLNKIYPHDASISADVYEVLQRTYQEAHIRGDLNASEDALSEMVLLNPKDVESQVAYANLLIRKGRLDDALDHLIYATNENPGNVELIRRAAGILMDSGRNMAALSLVRNQLAQHPSPALQRLYDSLMEDAARIEKDADAYQLYAKVYHSSKSPESLEYMMTQSIRRGYYDDALTYIGEMRAKTGPSPRLSMLEHEVHLRKGDQKSARRTLEAAAKQFPGEYDINLAYCELMLDDAAKLMSDGQYAAAIAPLEYVDARADDPEQRQNAVRRLSLCYRETGMFDKAEVKLNERLLYDPVYQVTAGPEPAGEGLPWGRRQFYPHILQEPLRREGDARCPGSKRRRGFSACGGHVRCPPGDESRQLLGSPVCGQRFRRSGTVHQGRRPVLSERSLVPPQRSRPPFGERPERGSHGVPEGNARHISGRSGSGKRLCRYVGPDGRYPDDTETMGSGADRAGYGLGFQPG